LKRLRGGGFEKVYDIGPRFRNEGVDDEHLPEHIAFESYAAYENYEDGMKLYEEMIAYIPISFIGEIDYFPETDMYYSDLRDIPNFTYDSNWRCYVCNGEKFREIYGKQNTSKRGPGRPKKDNKNK
jgi:lysyl-tRNA synthetase class II